MICLCMPTSTAMPSLVRHLYPGFFFMLHCQGKLCCFRQCSWLLRDSTHFPHAVDFAKSSPHAYSMHLPARQSFYLASYRAGTPLFSCIALIETICLAGALGQIDEMQTDSFAATLDFNVKGTFLGIKHAARCSACLFPGFHMLQTRLAASQLPIGIVFNQMSYGAAANEVQPSCAIYNDALC